jgi:hypothetical protein
MITMYLIMIYILGCILSLFIYNVVIYEKYNSKLFKEYSRKDIISGTFVLFSWFYLLTYVIKFKNIILKEV